MPFVCMESQHVVHMVCLCVNGVLQLFSCKVGNQIGVSSLQDQWCYPGIHCTVFKFVIFPDESYVQPQPVIYAFILYQKKNKTPWSEFTLHVRHDPYSACLKTSAFLSQPCWTERETCTCSTLNYKDSTVVVCFSVTSTNARALNKGLFVLRLCLHGPGVRFITRALFIPFCY